VKHDLVRLAAKLRVQPAARPDANLERLPASQTSPNRYSTQPLNLRRRLLAKRMQLPTAQHVEIPAQPLNNVVHHTHPSPQARLNTITPTHAQKKLRHTAAKKKLPGADKKIPDAGKNTGGYP
jgi:hypothetical protein